MKKLGLNEIREEFLGFFESHDHKRLKSYPLVPQNEKSLLLINAGMAPLKPFFTGELAPPAPRATSCQKCIRTPDIESVGKDARHGTYFEMLGNFSFGDYFKKEATALAWEFLTKTMEIPPEKLFISVFLEDDEAYEIWTRDVGVAPDHMVRLGRADNFWEIGAGPCGPCSEIYFDRGEKYGCGSKDCAPGCECDRYVEVWNLVFTQFNSDGKGNYTPLEKKNIDTGMGMERLACVMQDVDSLFDIDTIKSILQHVAKIAGVEYGSNAGRDVSLRIVTDHIRSTVMMVCDGVIPSNEGRGYVLRRLLRRAARHGRLLGIMRPFLAEVAETVICENEGIYPELREKQEYIKKLIQIEEERFLITIESGLVKLDEMILELQSSNEKVLGGDAGFKLYDTYGFPIDLTIEILEENALSLNREEFDELMKAQRKRARDARGNTTKLAWESGNDALKALPATKFTGYDLLEADAKILAILCDGEVCGGISEGMHGVILLEQTSFYAESGGQASDVGEITHNSSAMQVVSVSKTADGKFLHEVEVLRGSFVEGEGVLCSVNSMQRGAIMRAHSATHLLQKALRTVLGNHVEQAGSLVEADELRFDFTHFSAMTAEEITQVETIVNAEILDDDNVDVREMPIAEAKKLGAMALFGEKYGDVVRVVRMGDYSTELCGGTHVGNTAKIGGVKITSESSVAAGVRRVEAVCGEQILGLLQKREQMLSAVAGALKTTPRDILMRAEQLTGELKNSVHVIEKLNAKLAMTRSIELLNFAKAAGEVNVLSMRVEDATAETLRDMSDALREKGPKLVSVLAAVEDGKIIFVAGCGAEAIKKGAHAGNIIKQVAGICGGGGGGKPETASAGGKDVSKLEAALEAVNNIVEAMIK